MAPFNPFVASIGILRDLHFKLTLDERLRTEIAEFTAAPVAAVEPREARAWLEAAMSLTERCAAWLDQEATRVAEQRFAAGDPNSLRARLVGEPRKQIDGLLATLRQKMSGERAEWNRRISKQVLDINEALEAQLQSIEVEVAIEGSTGTVTITPSWLRAYEGWKIEVFASWGNHLARLLPSKYHAAVSGEIETVGGLLGGPVVVHWPTADAAVLPSRETGRGVQDRFEVPTMTVAVLESFKGGLNTVAMMAGMVVIPVIGSLMHQSPMELRAAVMGGLLVPIAGFAAVAGRGHRERLLAAQDEKSKERFRKQLKDEFKLTLDRFRTEVERVINAFAQECNFAVGAALDPAVAAWTDRREREVAQDLARAQLHSERLMDLLNTIRNARGGLTGTLLVDLRRKMSELDAARA